MTKESEKKETTSEAEHKPASLDTSDEVGPLEPIRGKMIIFGDEPEPEPEPEWAASVREQVLEMTLTRIRRRWESGQVERDAEDNIKAWQPQSGDAYRAIFKFEVDSEMVADIIFKAKQGKLYTTR